ncbi:MAG: hypothetical protein LC776_15580 [Acidobacteria bacterium]|nr:hypothetical protein [Acidobacteriota bacterium]
MPKRDESPEEPKLVYQYFDSHWRWILSITIVATLIATLIWGFYWYEKHQTDSAGTNRKQVGGLIASGPLITAEVKEVVTVDASVVYRRCIRDLLLVTNDIQLYQEVKVGGRTRLSLVSPLFPGTIEPISQEIQLIDSSGEMGYWAWQVRADKPGDHKLSLVLSILGPEGNDVQIQNRREEITLHVEKSFSYYAGVAWQTTTGFITSLTGIITAIVAAVVAIMGLHRLLSKT